MKVSTCATVWLIQQWNPGARFTLLDEPAAAPGICKGKVLSGARITLDNS